MSGFPFAKPSNADGSKRQPDVGDSAPTKTEVGDSAPTLNQQGTDLHVVVENGHHCITCVCNESTKCWYHSGVAVPSTDASSCELNPNLARKLGAIAMMDFGLLTEEPVNNVVAVVTVTGTQKRFNKLFQLLSPLFVPPICSHGYSKERKYRKYEGKTEEGYKDGFGVFHTREEGKDGDCEACGHCKDCRNGKCEDCRNGDWRK